MCGISVYHKKRGLTKLHLLEVADSLKKIAHRGPDGEGMVAISTQSGRIQLIVTEGTPKGALKLADCPILEINEFEDLSADLVLGHCRLSIIDLSILGHQPMSDPVNGNWLVFNGEIYNYIEIRSELRRYGHHFDTDTDTEVVLKSFSHWGKDCFKRFNGMWALLLWDLNKRELVISNDRFGVKPLFSFRSGDNALYVSEQKQLFSFSEFKFTYNTSKIQEYLKYGQLCTDEGTFFNEVKRFKPGYFCVKDFGNDASYEEISHCYYSLEMSDKNERIQPDEAMEKFTDLLDNAVKLRMRADVRYGFALSGGLDSTMVLYSAFRQKPEMLASFSAIFPGMLGDESDHIYKVTRTLPLKSYYSEPFREFSMESFVKHIYHQDYPVQSTSYYAEYELARTVKNAGYTVLLVGQGADELFGGYTTYFYQYGILLFGKMRLYKLVSEVKAYSKLKGIPSSRIFLSIYNQFKQVIKFKLQGNINFSERQKELAKCRSLKEILRLDLTSYTIPLYLHSDDADGMAFSIESRHPFLDYCLVDFAYSLPDHCRINNGWQKVLMRNAATELPNSIRWRKDKMGYTTPHQAWIEKYKNEFEQYARQASEFGEVVSSDVFRLASLGIWLTNHRTKKVF